MKVILPALLMSLAALIAAPVLAETTARRVTVTEWKTVFAKVEPRDSLPARSRLGGILQCETACKIDPGIGVIGVQK